MKKKWNRILLLLVLAVAVGSAGAFWLYTSDYRRLDPEFLWILEESDVDYRENQIHFQADSQVGLIFYPGGRVEYSAYAPLCQKLQQAGIQVFLVNMPFNMANFGFLKANNIMSDHPEVETWYVGGHSLGGVAANWYASGHSQEISGLILLGIYLSSDYDLEKTITINGSNDLRVGDSVTYSTNVHVIEGGNHAQFGNYGENEGDGQATISWEEQQDQAVALIVSFLDLGEPG